MTSKKSAPTTAPKSPPRDKRANFLRLAPKRTNAALKRIRMLRALANKSAYEYTPEDVSKILDALAKAVEDVDRAFEKRLVIEEEFKL